MTGNNTRAEFILSVVSTYETDVDFSLSLSSNNYRIVDSQGNIFGEQTILANSEDTYLFYIEVIDPTKISTSEQVLSVILNVNGKAKVVDNITLAVDEYEEFVDTEAPVISNLNFTQSNNYDQRGQGTLTWVGSDDSNINSYTIIVYKNNSALTPITNVKSNSYTFNDLEEDATYYFKVYGEDVHQNKASQYEIDNPSQSNNHCAVTESKKCEWVFDVVTHLTGNTSNGSGTANLGKTYSCTFSTESRYTLPSTITVKMNGTTVSSSNYSYSSSNGSFSINNVTGPLDITVNANRNSGCLVEGTEVRLYDGTCKKIEDISYNDLLSVWSYDTGKTVPDYPIWVEKESSSCEYILIEFDDGTDLKIVKDHALFDVDQNMFVSISDKDSFKIGSNIVKIDNSGKIYAVKVENIEIIDEEVNYYHILSTKYFNIIANDFLTTDDSVILSNIFGFDENITWPKSRYEIISKKNNLFKYKDFKDILPYSLFVGCRALEAKVICDNGFMSKEDFIEYLYGNTVNPDMHLEPEKSKQGKYLWYITTSLDDLKNNYNNQYKEGSYYRLPKLDKKNGLKPYWYNAVTNEYYKGGTKIKVNYSMHFELIYK